MSQTLLDCSENVDEEAVKQWINENLTLECFEVLSDDDIVSRVTCVSEETRNFEECPGSDEEILVTHKKLSHGDALVHTEAFLNYLEQEDESTPTEKILRNLRSIIHRRVNEKQNRCAETCKTCNYFNMSQKYKSFSRTSDRSVDSGLPPGVKRMGYLRKLKKMKRRFFVLHMESNYGVARLEYYSSEKKWKFGCEPRRCIELKSCLNISRKLHSKHKNAIAIYTQDDCFSVVTETPEELELWLNDLLEVQRSYMDVEDGARGRHVYGHCHYNVKLFLTNFQSEKVCVPYLYAELSQLLGEIIKKFVKPEKVVEGSALLKLDLNSKAGLLEVKNIDIDFGAKNT
ncbi:hypothetical protein AVEN_245813-1 [Araneus ventricosus]|uniref:PH domain-containing protein n=1 Tax=Araneus ventricosus TaxID=182803 RepID=A0A4Y2E8A8_ARAVE|nr:hypothetical protein AVEN_245813-1 [Araneus ventricosus]